MSHSPPVYILSSLLLACLLLSLISCICIIPLYILYISSSFSHLLILNVYIPSSLLLLSFSLISHEEGGLWRSRRKWAARAGGSGMWRSAEWTYLPAPIPGGTGRGGTDYTAYLAALPPGITGRRHAYIPRPILTVEGAGGDATYLPPSPTRTCKAAAT